MQNIYSASEIVLHNSSRKSTALHYGPQGTENVLMTTTILSKAFFSKGPPWGVINNLKHLYSTFPQLTWTLEIHVASINYRNIVKYAKANPSQ